MSDIKRVPLTTLISGSSSGNINSTIINNDIINNINKKSSNFGGILYNNRNSSITPSDIVSTIAASSISYSSTAAAMMSTTTVSSSSSTIPLLINQSGGNTSVGGSSGSGGGGGSSNITSSNKNLKTLRLTLELFEPNSDSFPEFNYSKLIYVEKKKMKKIKEKRNGLSDPFEDNDDDVARIAKEMEMKYGNYGSTSRKNDLCDKGLGYDESDSFIDNTEAYDEVIPDEVETGEGGFYINSGQLEFKHLSKYEKETEEIVKMVKAKKRVFETSSEESEETDDSEEDDEEDDDDDTATEIDIEEQSSKNNNKIRNGHADKRHKSSGEHESSSSSSSKSKSKSKHQDKLSNKIAQKDVKKVEHVSGGTVVDLTPTEVINSEKTIKTTTVKDMLKAKRDNFLKMQDDKVKMNGSKSENDSSDTSEDDSDSDDNEPSQKKLKPSSDGIIDDPEKLRTSDTKLPEDLSTDLCKSIKDMKDTAKLNNRIGKNFQFDTQMTDIFLKIDDFTICIDKSIRNQIFAHIEYQLMLPKYYLLRKAKQLRIKQEKHKIKKSYLKLKKSVSEVMPSVKLSYDAAYAKVEEIRGKIPAEELQKMDKPPKFPKKKFPWNDSMRNLLYDLYQVRWTSYTVLRTRKETFEEFVNNYLKEKVVSIWPSGWMKYDELKKELEKRKNATKKVKDIKKTNEPSQIGTASSSALSSITYKNLETSSNTGNTSNKSSASGNQISNLPKSALSTNNSLPVVVGSNDLVVTISTGKSNNTNIGSSVGGGGSSGGGTGNCEKTAQNSISIIPVSDTNDNKISRSHNTGKKNDNKHHSSSSSNKLDINNSNASLITSSGNKSSVIDLISPTKRTDHSINSIISASPTSSTSSQHSRTSPNLIEPSSTTSSTTHIITVDNYKNTSDIINSSKTILFNNNQNYSNNSSNSNIQNIKNNNTSPKENSIRISSVSSINKSVELKSIRRNTVDSISSNGSSDDVEIVGCYTNPKKQSSTTNINATSTLSTTILKKNKYTKNKNHNDLNPSIISHNKIKIESKSSTNNNSSSSSGESGISLKSKNNNSSAGIKKNYDYDKANESESDNRDSDIDVYQILNSLKELEEMQQKNKTKFDSNSHSSTVSFNKDIKQ